ncbi:MAG: biopolymer transporter ExbD [Pseudomonadota bacterium]
MRMRRHSGSESDGEAGIDLAPMLDFVMNLLIFFIITAVFVKEVGFSLSRPAASAQSTPQQEKKDSKTLYIVLHNGGEVSIDKRPIDVRAVRANVERFKAESPEGPVIVVANSKSPTGLLVQVMDQVRLGGVLNVSIASTGG